MRKENFRTVSSTSDSIIWIPSSKINKFSSFYLPSSFERNIFKASLFAYTYWNKLWNRLHHMVTLEGFLKKIHRDVSKTIATAKLELFVALFSSFQLLTDFTKNLNIECYCSTKCAFRIITYFEICPGDQIKYYRTVALF